MFFVFFFLRFYYFFTHSVPLYMPSTNSRPCPYLGRFNSSYPRWQCALCRPPCTLMCDCCPVKYVIFWFFIFPRGLVKIEYASHPLSQIQIKRVRFFIITVNILYQTAFLYDYFLTSSTAKLKIRIFNLTYNNSRVVLKNAKLYILFICMT